MLIISKKRYSFSSFIQGSMSTDKRGFFIFTLLEIRFALVKPLVAFGNLFLTGFRIQ